MFTREIEWISDFHELIDTDTRRILEVVGIECPSNLYRIWHNEGESSVHSSNRIGYRRSLYPLTPDIGMPWHDEYLSCMRL